MSWGFPFTFTVHCRVSGRALPIAGSGALAPMLRVVNGSLRFLMIETRQDRSLAAVGFFLAFLTGDTAARSAVIRKNPIGHPLGLLSRTRRQATALVSWS